MMQTERRLNGICNNWNLGMRMDYFLLFMFFQADIIIEFKDFSHEKR